MVQERLKSIPHGIMSAFVATVCGLSLVIQLAVNVPTATAGLLCERKGIPIWITIEKIRNSHGTIKVELYSIATENGLKYGTKVNRTRINARQGSQRLCLTAPSYGDYSIAIYHDENDNKELDRSYFGIPYEGFGFSNNPSVTFGIPDQQEMLFKVSDSPKSVYISIIYL